VLKAFLSLLSTIDYDYSVVDSTKFTDWLKALHELFIDVRVRVGHTLFPVHAKLTGSEVEFVKGIPGGGGVMLGDGAFDAKPVINTIKARILLRIIKILVSGPMSSWTRPSLWLWPSFYPFSYACLGLYS
jgi:hypothetical protein